MNTASIVSGLADAGSVLYNHYYPKEKTFGAHNANMKYIGHYTKSGNKLGTYHKAVY